MAKVDEVLKQLILFHGKRIARDVLGDLPAQMKQARQDIRATEKALEKLTRQVERLVEQSQPEPSIPAVPEDQLKGPRLTKRTLPSVRKRLGLTQGELAKLLGVSALTISQWENGKSKPGAASVAKIIALRAMSQEQVHAALGRQEATVPAMNLQQIRDLRQKMGLTQGEFAKRLSVSTVTVGSWERGQSAPRAHNLGALERLAATGKKQGEGVVEEKKTSKEVEEPAERVELPPQEILDIRKKAGLSQGDMAKVLGASMNSVWAWEKGRAKPRANSLKKLLAMRK